MNVYRLRLAVLLSGGCLAAWAVHPGDFASRAWTARAGGAFLDAPDGDRLAPWTLSTANAWKYDRGVAVESVGRITQTVRSLANAWGLVAGGPATSPTPGVVPPNAPTREHAVYRYRDVKRSGAVWTEWIAPTAGAPSDWAPDDDVAGRWRFADFVYGLGGREVTFDDDGSVRDTDSGPSRAQWRERDGLVRLENTKWLTTDYFVLSDDGAELCDLHGFVAARRARER